LVLAFVRFPSLLASLVRWAGFLAILLGILAVLQFLGIFCPLKAFGLVKGELAAWPGSGGRFFHARGLLYHHNPFSYGCIQLFFLSLGALLFGMGPENRSRDRCVAGMGGAASLTCILLSGSRGAWFAVGIGFLLVAATVLRRQWKVLVLIAAIAVCGFLAIGEPLSQRLGSVARPYENNHRLPLWRISLQMFAEKPWFGHGYHHSFELERERFMTEAEKQDPMFPTEPHSMYFDFLGSTGLFGLAAVLFFLFEGFQGYFAAMRRESNAASQGILVAGLGSLGAFAVGSAFDSHFFHTQTLMMTLFVLAMGQSVVFRSAEPKIVDRVLVPQPV
jgi:O-antigen ligase